MDLDPLSRSSTASLSEDSIDSQKIFQIVADIDKLSDKDIKQLQTWKTCDPQKPREINCKNEMDSLMDNFGIFFVTMIRDVFGIDKKTFDEN